MTVILKLIGRVRILSRIPTDHSSKAPSNGHLSHVHDWLTIIGKDADLPAAIDRARKASNGEQAWP